MANLTTATVPVPVVNIWDVPPDPQMGLIPRGEVIFADAAVAIPALGAGDERLWTVQMNLPRNFHYRFVEAQVSAFFALPADVESFGSGMRVLVSSDAPGFAQWSFAMVPAWMPSGTANNEYQCIINFTSVTNNLWANWHPAGVFDSFIDAANGSARLLMSWCDVNDTTAALTTAFRFRALMYDQDQVRRWPVHTPFPGIGP